MTRIEVLTSIILAVAAAHNVEPTSIVVHEVIGDTDRLLGQRLPMLVTVSSSGNVQHVRPGARVVVLHAQDARTLDMQIAHLLEIGVGFIVIPNANPAEEEQQTQPRGSSVWTGDGWKSVARVRATSDRHVMTVDADHGTAVICPAGSRIPAETYEMPPAPTWAGLVEHRAVWLGLVAPEHFADLLSGVMSPTPAPSADEASTVVDDQPETVPAVEPAEPVATPASAVEPTRTTTRRSRRS
jgi:hypothetical protein